ncbi:MAG: hypothetical protein KJ872_06070 [Alphaproteobacteria bacterium]|nr:hypothetical protein [Alphaproteobacteria bacterium]
MFEKANSISTPYRAFAGGVRPDEGARVHRAVQTMSAARFESRVPRRAGDALRAVEWSEITARLNAARDLRLLLRNEVQALIEGSAASFGDAAASYFALLEDNEPDVNHDALEQSKALDDMLDANDANRSGDAKEMQ